LYTPADVGAIEVQVPIGQDKASQIRKSIEQLRVEVASHDPRDTMTAAAAQERLQVAREAHEHAALTFERKRTEVANEHEIANQKLQSLMVSGIYIVFTRMLSNPVTYR
jgi:hypothetical protein